MSADGARRVRQYFETELRPPVTVIFDDGKMERCLPYAQFNEAYWPHRDRNTLNVEIGNWLVVLRGQNLAPLFEAISNHTLRRVDVLAQLLPGGSMGIEEADTFVTEILFTVPPLKMTAAQVGKGGGGQLPLLIGGLPE